MMRKRIGVIVLVLALLCAMLPAQAVQAVDAMEVVSYAVKGGNLYFQPLIYTQPPIYTIVGCDESVTVADIPAKINDGFVERIAMGAFYECSNLTSITIPFTLTEIGDIVFSDCSSLRTINVSILNPTYSSDRGVLLNKETAKVVQCPQKFAGAYEIPDNITTIGHSAFGNCRDLTDVTIPESVTSIGSYAFSSCSSLKSVAIPAGVTEIGLNAFLGCSSLTAINIAPENPTYSSDQGVLLNKEKTELIEYPGGLAGAYQIPDGVTKIRMWAFTSCSGLTSVTIPASVTEIGSAAFDDGCNNLKDVFYMGSEAQWQQVKIAGTNDSLLRATIHYNATVPFTDVSSNMWYADAVSWAVKNGITNGMSDTLFMPERNCTRGQIVTFLWRANGSPEPQSTVNPFMDVFAGQYYYKAVLWAVEQNITTGIDETHFKPDNICTRGQAVTFQWRAAGKPAPASSRNPFEDVPDTQFYHDAVLWAVEQNITTGTAATTFKPDNTCTRGHIVTFLYRDLAQ